MSFQGIYYCETTIEYIDRQDATPPTPVFVIGIDLQSPGIRFEYIIASGVDKNGQFGECKDVNRTAYGEIGCDMRDNPNYYPLIDWEDAKNEYPDTVIVVTSDYGATSQNPPESRGHGPEGLTVVRGNRLDGPSMSDGDNNTIRRPWLAISQSPPLIAKISQLNSDDGGKPYDWLYTGVGGAPWLINNGELTTGEIDICNQAPGSCYAEASQTAVGLSQDGKWLFLVVGDHPQTLLDMATFMHQKLPVYKAIKFDGGGSTKLYYDGEDRFIDSNRQLSQYLAVIALPNGEAPPTIPPNDDAGSWFQHLIDVLVQYMQAVFNQIFQHVQEFLDQTIQNMQTQVREWLAEQLESMIQAITEWLNNLLLQCAGSSTLILVSSGLGLAQWRKRRYCCAGSAAAKLSSETNQEQLPPDD